MSRLLLGITIGVLLVSLQAHSHNLPRKFVTGALCIHRYEGSWRDTGAPYYGGMQMDEGFMGLYGTWLRRHVGTADRWTPHQQLVVSFRAYRGWKGYGPRYWGPWPATSRKCGLL